jgi:hypothetical protein
MDASCAMVGTKHQPHRAHSSNSSTTNKPPLARSLPSSIALAIRLHHWYSMRKTKPKRFRRKPLLVDTSESKYAAATAGSRRLLPVASPHFTYQCNAPHLCHIKLNQNAHIHIHGSESHSVTISDVARAPLQRERERRLPEVAKYSRDGSRHCEAVRGKRIR